MLTETVEATASTNENVERTGSLEPVLDVIPGHATVAAGAAPARVVVAGQRALLHARGVVAQDGRRRTARPLGQGGPPRPLVRPRLRRHRRVPPRLAGLGAHGIGAGDALAGDT